MNNIYYGVNPVFESLKNDRVDKLFIADDFNNQKIIELAKKKNVVTEIITKKLFISKFGNNSQGCAVKVKDFKLYSLDEIIKNSKNNKNSIIVILDELSDPHNLGAILRSSDVFAVDAVVYKKHNSVSLNETVAKTSAGAINYVKCCEVANLSQTIKTLKEKGYWVIGLAGEAKSDLNTIPKDVPLAIVVGSEGYGISQLVRKNCDLLAKIPMQGHVSCLNASVSCAIVLYHLRNK